MRNRMFMISIGMFSMGIACSVQGIEEAGVMYMLGTLFMLKSLKTLVKKYN